MRKRERTDYSGPVDTDRMVDSVRGSGREEMRKEKKEHEHREEEEALLTTGGERPPLYSVIFYNNQLSKECQEEVEITLVNMAKNACKADKLHRPIIKSVLSGLAKGVIPVDLNDKAYISSLIGYLKPISTCPCTIAAALRRVSMITVANDNTWIKLNRPITEEDVRDYQSLPVPSDDDTDANPCQASNHITILPGGDIIGGDAPIPMDYYDHVGLSAYKRLSYSLKYRPGYISPQLREALGMSTNELPPYIENMWVHGYPPGYM
eukprot:Ihof_evm1s209 gene=Ihof_evmTU1s209